MEPWGTPQEISESNELELFIETYCFLFEI